MATSKKKLKYIMPSEQEYSYSEELYFANPPNSKCWVHGEQFDDVIDEKVMRRVKQVAKLKKINASLAVQRTKEWYEARDTMITASLLGTCLNQNHYEPQYMAIVGKLITVPFNGTIPAYKGKKFETISCMIYQYRMNVIVKEYGCIRHPCAFIGSSPDGIVDNYKLDGIHKTNLVGRMLEIKNVQSRKINMTSNDIFQVIPSYYYPQVQAQLQCCDLDECDFWQTKIEEYTNREEFIADTNPKEPFRSKSFGYEKGVLIELIEFGNIDNKGYMNMVYENSKWIFPPKIEMTPFECDSWVANTISTYKETYPELKDYLINRVIYWRLEQARCVTVKRDNKWFDDNLPIIEKIWFYVTFLRNKDNEKQKKIFLDYVKMMEEKYVGSHNHEKRNEIVMEFVKKLCNAKNKKYEKIVTGFETEISEYYNKDSKHISDGGDEDFPNFNVC